ncbi:MAG: response regulator [Nitrospirae bacterium]|nr:response regulator [Nitrospirota bacterium]
MIKSAILCVDDEESVLKSLKDQLKRHFGNEYIVETCESAGEAIEVIKELLEKKIDLPLVISDYVMPVIKGDELLILIHDINPRIVKILLTGQGDADAIGKSLKYAKLYRYISKPWDQGDLILTVTEALRCYFQEKSLEKNSYMQNATSKLLKLSLKDVDLEDQLLYALEQILSVPLSTIQKRGCIFILEEGSEETPVKVHVGIDENSVNLCNRLSFDECACGRAAINRKIVFNGSFGERHDIKHHDIKHHDTNRHDISCTDMSANGKYCIPILSGNKIFGVISLNLEKGCERNRQEEEFLVSIANTLACIIERKRAEEGLRKHRDTLEDIVIQRTAELTYARDQAIAANEHVKKRKSELIETNRRLQSEIQRRIEVENKITASLRDKETLLKEVHHRVKNNLQIISSLLYLHSTTIGEPCAQDALNESCNRIRSMALIHETLYKSENLATIDFSQYLKSLMGDLFYTFGVDPETITLKYDLHAAFLKLETAIPCGLIINEIVSNSLKYAFPKGTRGKISISLHKRDDNGYELSIGDNGIGLPRDLNFDNVSSLGLRLIKTLSDQLEGSVELNRTGGTRYKIIFKDLSETNAEEEN